MEKVIKYVEGLEKAYALIEGSSSLSELEDFENKIKKVRDELGFIIGDIDNEFHNEFYGEEE